MQAITIFAIGFFTGFLLYLFATVAALLYFSYGINEEMETEPDYYYDDIF